MDMKGFRVMLGIGLAILVCGWASAKEPLLIYTSTPVEIMTRFEQMFEAKYPDIDLQVFRSGTGTIVAKIAAEREAGRIVADLIWVAEYTYLEQLKAQGLLYKYESPEAKGIPALLADPEGYYYGARIFALVIAYNTNLVKDPPRRWTDLLDPKWKGQIIVANPSYSGSVAIAATVLGLNYGLDFFRGLAANETTVVQGNSQVVTEVAAGAYKVGLTLDNMVRDLQAQGSPIALIYPDDGPIFLPSPIGIFATSQRLEAAKKFVDFVLSAEGQKALVEIGRYIPARSDVEGPIGAPTLDELVAKAMPADIHAVLANIDFFTQQFVKILLGD
ncbi:MAG: ABC transporter substrate-binding protein [Candidatus Bathyarchaeia archaeon]